MIHVNNNSGNNVQGGSSCNNKPQPPQPQPTPDCFAESTTVHECTNVNLTPASTIKVPVVLFEPEVQVCVEANISLDQPALEIKRVLKDVFIDQCRLVATTFDAATNTVTAGKLFLFGHIRKNIEFAAAEPERFPGSCVHGTIRHNTVCLDWECCTPIDFTGSTFRPALAPVVQQSFEFLDKKGHNPNLNKKQFHNEVVYNEQPYCEIVSARFDEIDVGFKFHSKANSINGQKVYEAKSPDGIYQEGCDLDKTFQFVKEKIVLHLTLKLLQVQQVPITLS